MASQYGAMAEPYSGLGANETLLAAESVAVTPTMVSKSPHKSRKIIAFTVAAATSGMVAVLSRGHLMSSGASSGMEANALDNIIDDGYYDDYIKDNRTDDDYYNSFGETASDTNSTFNTSGLTCNYFDDDTVYPNNGCNYGDSGVCVEAVSESTRYAETCSLACDQGSMDLYSTGSTEIDAYNNASWAVVCGWEAIKNLPSLCNETFTPNLEQTASQAQDVKPRAYDTKSRVHTQNVTGTTYHGCNLHAFCISCEMTNSDGSQTYNKYCQAMVDFYGEGALYELKTFFNHLDDFWCESDILSAIDAGTFNDDYHKWTDTGTLFGGSKDSKSAEDDDILFGVANRNSQDDDPFNWEKPPITGNGAVGGGQGPAVGGVKTHPSGAGAVAGGKGKSAARKEH